MASRLALRRLFDELQIITALVRQSLLDCSGRVQAGRREDRHRSVVRPDEQLELGAAQDHSLSAGGHQSVDDRPVPLAGLLADDTQTELFVDGAVDHRPVLRGRDDHLEAVRCQPVLVEGLLHRKCRAEKPDPVDTFRADRLDDDVSDTQQRDGHCQLDRVGHLVHGVGAQHKKVGPCRLQGPSDGREELSGCLPGARGLEPFDLGEVD